MYGAVLAFCKCACHLLVAFCVSEPGLLSPLLLKVRKGSDKRIKEMKIDVEGKVEEL